MESKIGGNLEEIRALLNIEQPRDESQEKQVNKEIIVEEDHKYTLEELAAILSEMYNDPKVVNKTTAVHMFGLKYGDVIKEQNIAATNLVTMANINSSYHAEVSKGVRIYESILNNEYGVRFYDDSQVSNMKNAEKKILPKRKPRKCKVHSVNSILYGAPGTGKTYSTVAYAIAMIDNKKVDLSERDLSERKEEVSRYNALVDEGRVVFTTFHQNYGYEDFIQGLRPDTTSEGMAFKDVDGVLKKIADRAIKDQENNYVIIIDEINRANISKVFGELITLIEEDKRWGEVNGTCATLPSGELFAVPNNLYIIGTMNSSDKSISLIDAALRRRFEFIEQKPNPELIKDTLLKKIFIHLNEKLVNELDSTDLLIGHSYFMNKTEKELPSILNRSIIPLLYEYFYDNRKKVANILSETLQGTNIEVINEKFGRLYVKEKKVKE